MPSPGLATKLKGRTANKQTKRTEPLWKGPEVDGVTQSLLSRFLCCRERFRLLVVDGLKPAPEFIVRVEYGNMWHVCEEAYAANLPWLPVLKTYCVQLCQKFKPQSELINHWFHICKLQFPIYATWWENHPDVKQRTPLLQEQVFDVPYMLPSGRAVRLRGKWDSVDLIGKGKSAGIYIQENKSKGSPDLRDLQRQLTFDLQTMMYIIALQTDKTDWEVGGTSEVLDQAKIAGVRYNVVRRPLAGGKFSIVQHKDRTLKDGKSKPGETPEQFYDRLAGLIEGAHGQSVELPKAEHYFFMRWKVEITQGDIDRFKRECFDPILEELCDWWNHVSSMADPFTLPGLSGTCHYRLPYGIYNPLLEERSSDLDTYLETGSELGLQRTDQLFGELQ